MARLALADERCEKLMDEKMRGLRPDSIQADEAWGYVGTCSSAWMRTRSW